jgi:hypothetical protein
VEYGLAVALGLKRAFTENRTQVGVIVNLPVRNEEIVGVVDRLGTVLRADNRQATVRHDRGYVRRTYHIDFIRPAVGDFVDHSLGKGCIVNLP